MKIELKMYVDGEYSGPIHCFTSEFYHKGIAVTKITSASLVYFKKDGKEYGLASDPLDFDDITASIKKRIDKLFP